MTKDLAVQKKEVGALFERPEIKKQLQRAIPKHLTVDRLLRTSMTAIRTNPKLLQCTQQSLLACVMGCAALGLEPEPFLGQAYLVPYKRNFKDANGKWHSQMEAQLIPGYRGYISLARRTGEVQSVSAQVVYENDRFDLKFGLHETLDHEPAEGDRGAVKGAYVIFRYKDGSYSFDYMSRADIDKIRERSKAKESGPWVTDYEEMAKKTVIRRHVKLAPLSVELAKAAASENMAIAGESQVDFFIGNEAQGQIEHIPPMAENFYEMIQQQCGDFPDAEMDEFIKVTADGNGVTVEEIKAGATSDIDGFWTAFQQWRAKRQPDPTTTHPTADPEPGPDTSENDGFPCEVEGCGFIAKSERGLKKHMTQQHGGGEPDEKAEQTEADQIVKLIKESYMDVVQEAKADLGYTGSASDMSLFELKKLKEKCVDLKAFKDQEPPDDADDLEDVGGPFG